MPIVIAQAGKVPTGQLDKLGPVERPLSSPASELVGKRYFAKSPDTRMLGIWECSPGRWQRTVMQEEFAHFIEGSARFVPADGEPIDIRAGDAVWFPPNTRGVWEIHEKVRKVYIILYPRNPVRAAWSRLRAFATKLGRWVDIRPRLERGAEAGATARDGAPKIAIRRL